VALVAGSWAIINSFKNFNGKLKKEIICDLTKGWRGAACGSVLVK
jgi:hypothetical protein